MSNTTGIHITGLVLPAVVCKKCGARVWPANAMWGHKVAHKKFQERAYGNQSPAKGRPHKTGPRATPLKRESDKDRPRGINIGTRSAGARL